jgi:Flp pilus assembly protein TadG
MALILPLLLALAGGATDLARAYHNWLTVESASRNAAEYVATNSCSTNLAATTCSTASTDAQRVVCTETQNLPGFVAGTGPNPVESCTAPNVTTTWSTCNGSSAVVGDPNYCPGGSTKNPIRTATVTVGLQFATIVPWPMISHDGVTVSSQRRYSIVVGR